MIKLNTPIMRYAAMEEAVMKRSLVLVGVISLAVGPAFAGQEPIDQSGQGVQTREGVRVADSGLRSGAWDLGQLIDVQSLWKPANAVPGDSVRSASSKPATPEQIDKALSDLLVQRAEWSAGRSDSSPGVEVADAAGGAVPPSVVIEKVPQSQLEEALESLLAERASWGTAPWDNSPSLAAGDYDVLTTSDLERLLAQRGSWGKGPEAKVVEAPLAAGAVAPLPKAEQKPIVAASAEPIVHEPNVKPVAELNRVPAAEIDKALADLFATREAWAAGTPAPASKNEQVAEADADGGIVNLVTSSLEALLAQRSTWGSSVEKEIVEAPLAAGAEAPLLAPQVVAAKQESGAPIVHAAQITPVADVEAVPQKTIRQALANLLDERASWGSAPGQSGGAAVLSTTSLQQLLAQRDAWGPGREAEPVTAPLAAGARFPLPMQERRKVAASTAPPIVHAAQLTPPAVLTPVPQNELASRLAALLDERESWGSAPSNGAFPVLSTASVGELLDQRERWGAGAPAAKVEAPLAADAQFPLPVSARAPKDETPAAAPIVHAAINTPAPELTKIDQATLEKELAGLLRMRASWGTAPKRAPEGGYAVLSTKSVAALIKERSEWGTAPQAPTLADLTPVPDNKPEIAYPTLATAGVAELLAQRDAWGGGQAVSVAKAVPTQTGAIGPAEEAGCSAKLSSVASGSGITFRSSSAEILGPSSAALKRVADIAKTCPGVRILIEGHTDSSGSAEKNQILSEARAKSVMAYLENAGVDKGQLSAIGFGETKPLVPNTTRANKTKNRRIEFTVLAN